MGMLGKKSLKHGVHGVFVSRTEVLFVSEDRSILSSAQSTSRKSMALEDDA